MTCKALGKALVLPRISVFPTTDAVFVRAVDEIAMFAGGLASAIDAAMLTIPVSGEGPHDVTAWSQRLATSPGLSQLLADTPLFQPALTALASAATSLIDRLGQWGWCDIDAEALCLVTDGHGVMLAIDRPAPDADCGWLLDLARSYSHSHFVRAPSTHGIWPLILADAGRLN